MFGQIIIVSLRIISPEESQSPIKGSDLLMKVNEWANKLKFKVRYPSGIKKVNKD